MKRDGVGWLYLSDQDAHVTAHAAPHVALCGAAAPYFEAVVRPPTVSTWSCQQSEGERGAVVTKRPALLLVPLV